VNVNDGRSESTSLPIDKRHKPQLGRACIHQTRQIYYPVVTPLRDAQKMLDTRRSLELKLG